MRLALSTCARDFHPLDCAHAGRTQKVAIGIIATDENVTEQLLSLSIRNNGILIEVLLEEINEIALEYTGDNIVETTDTKIYIYEDYIENISNVIRPASNCQ